MDEKLDEQCRLIIEEFLKLPRQYQEWFYIAGFEPEPEYQAMLQTIENENERQWVMDIREVYADSRHEYKKSALSPTPTKAKGKDAHTVTAEIGRYGDYTTAAARNQEEE